MNEYVDESSSSNVKRSEIISYNYILLEEEVIFFQQNN